MRTVRPFLFFFGERFNSEAKNLAVENLLASWYYLAGRHKLFEQFQAGQADYEGSEFRALYRVGELLSQRRQHVPEGDQRDHIEAILSQWRELRRAVNARR